MALIHHAGKLLFYAHVPKTGGTSIEHFLTANFGEVGLFDDTWTAFRSFETGFVTSPQHLAASAVERIFPEGAIDYSFAVVRHPLDRMLSSFRFQANGGLREKLRHIGFSAWCEAMLSAAEREPTFSDNHFRPQSDLVPEGAEVFQLEEGLEPLERRLAEVLGQPSLQHGVERKNVSRPEPANMRLTQADVQRINAFYAADFERFGYAPKDPEGVVEGGHRAPALFMGRPLGWLLSTAWKQRLIRN